MVGTENASADPAPRDMLSSRPSPAEVTVPDDAPRLAHEPDPTVGAWIGERLGPFGATVGGLVPRGYAAYARVLHRLVVDLLAAHTAGGVDAEVVAALWEGFGWVDGQGVVTVTVSPEGVTRERLAPAFSPEVLAAPRLELPHRAYLLFRGPLGAVLPWCRAGAPGYWQQTPNLLWPTDRTWCLATEIDLDSTVVAGPRALVDAICAHPDLEAFEVGEGDSLMVDGDDVNV